MVDLNVIQNANDLELSEHNAKEFGTIKIAITSDGEVLLHAKDSATILGYSNSNDAILTHVYPEYYVMLTNKNFKPRETRGLKLPNRGAMFLSQAGFIQLVQNSKLPSAVKINKWVLEELIPEAIATHNVPTDLKGDNLISIIRRSQDPKFKAIVSELVTDIAREAATVKGYVWKMFVRRFNILYGTNLTARLNKFKKDHGIKHFTMREFLDAVGEKDSTIMVLKSLLCVSKFREEHDMATVMMMLFTLLEGKSPEELHALDIQFDELHQRLREQIAISEGSKVLNIKDYREKKEA